MTLCVQAQPGFRVRGAGTTPSLAAPWRPAPPSILIPQSVHVPPIAPVNEKDVSGHRSVSPWSLTTLCGSSSPPPCLPLSAPGRSRLRAPPTNLAPSLSPTVQVYFPCRGRQQRCSTVQLGPGPLFSREGLTGGSLAWDRVCDRGLAPPGSASRLAVRLCQQGRGRSATELSASPSGLSMGLPERPGGDGRPYAHDPRDRHEACSASAVSAAIFHWPLELDLMQGGR